MLKFSGTIKVHRSNVQQQHGRLNVANRLVCVLPTVAHICCRLVDELNMSLPAYPA